MQITKSRVKQLIQEELSSVIQNFLLEQASKQPGVVSRAGKKPLPKDFKQSITNPFKHLQDEITKCMQGGDQTTGICKRLQSFAQRLTTPPAATTTVADAQKAGYTVRRGQGAIAIARALGRKGIKVNWRNLRKLARGAIHPGDVFYKDPATGKVALKRGRPVRRRGRGRRRPKRKTLGKFVQGVFGQTRKGPLSPEEIERIVKSTPRPPATTDAEKETIKKEDEARAREASGKKAAPTKYSNKILKGILGKGATKARIAKTKRNLEAEERRQAGR